MNQAEDTEEKINRTGDEKRERDRSKWECSLHLCNKIVFFQFFRFLFLFFDGEDNTYHHQAQGIERIDISKIGVPCSFFLIIKDKEQEESREQNPNSQKKNRWKKEVSFYDPVEH